MSMPFASSWARKALSFFSMFRRLSQEQTFMSANANNLETSDAMFLTTMYCFKPQSAIQKLARLVVLYQCCNEGTNITLHVAFLNLI